MAYALRIYRDAKGNLFDQEVSLCRSNLTGSSVIVVAARSALRTSCVNTRKIVPGLVPMVASKHKSFVYFSKSKRGREILGRFYDADAGNNRQLSAGPADYYFRRCRLWQHRSPATAGCGQKRN